MRWVYLIGLFFVSIPFIGMRFMWFRRMGDWHLKDHQMREDWRLRNHYRGAEDIDLLNQIPPRNRSGDDYRDSK